MIIININMIAGSEDILQTPYSDTFSCEGQGYGYYADVQSGCQVIKQELLTHNFPQQVTLWKPLILITNKAILIQWNVAYQNV